MGWWICSIEWTDMTHSYYKDIRNLIGDIMIEEEAKAEYNKKELKKQKG